jgi:hypothetical protein
LTPAADAAISSDEAATVDTEKAVPEREAPHGGDAPN